MVALRFLLLFKFVSNPTVSSKRERELSGEIKTRSGLRESPVTNEGDEKQGISAYNKQCFKNENDLARKGSTEL